MGNQLYATAAQLFDQHADSGSNALNLIMMQNVAQVLVQLLFTHACLDAESAADSE